MYRPAQWGKKMAELDFDQYGTGTGVSRAAQISKAINFAGAACSIALVVGLSVWGYKLAVRDVNGVPVMRAMAGLMREAPKKPGGEVILHQGLSVNAVAAVGMAASLPDQVILAPAPVDLTAEDAPGLGIGPVATAEAEIGNSAINPKDLPALQSGLDTDAAIAMALADALAAGAAPFADLDPAPAGSLAAQRPKPRPAPGSVAASVQAPAEIDPKTLEVGTRLVQLGAFDDATTARSEWARMQLQFGDLFTSKSMVIQTAESGGVTFYRLRAHGFAGEEDARWFCSALVAENTPCIPTQHR